MRRPEAEIEAEIVESLRELDGSDGKSFFAELVELFRSQKTEYLSKLEKAIGENQPAKVAQILHQLKSSSGNLGASAFSALCGEFEEAAAAGDISRFREKMSEFKELYDEIITNLESLSKSG